MAERKSKQSTFPGLMALRGLRKEHNLTNWNRAREAKGLYGYVGFDPTASSLHVGNLIPVLLLKHLMAQGHKACAIIGNGTALIGDPSGKDDERPLISHAKVNENTKQLKKQLQGLLGKETPIFGNKDWISPLGVVEFLRDTGKHFPINYLLSKDTNKARLKKGITYTEFSYQLLQAYDFYHLHEKEGVNLQMGGSDQWGNILSGIDLIRRTTTKEVYGLTSPLLERAKGQKFGKSEKGDNVWLAPAQTSPYQFYQYWINLDDVLATQLYRFTHPKAAIARHKPLPDPFPEAPEQVRGYQRWLAEYMTEWVHGERKLKTVRLATRMLFDKVNANSVQTAKACEVVLAKEIPFVPIPAALAEDTSLAGVLSHNGGGGVFASKGSVRRAIKEGALSIGGVRVKEDRPLQKEDYYGSYVLARFGKKKHLLVQLT